MRRRAMLARGRVRAQRMAPCATAAHAAAAGHHPDHVAAPAADVACVLVGCVDGLVLLVRLRVIVALAVAEPALDRADQPEPSVVEPRALVVCRWP